MVSMARNYEQATEEDHKSIQEEHVSKTGEGISAFMPRYLAYI